MSGAPDAPGVPLDDADHTGRTRRAESARAVSGYAVRARSASRRPPNPLALRFPSAAIHNAAIHDSRIRD